MASEVDMVILKVNTEKDAADIAYMLRGRQYGRYILLFKEDNHAIELAISLTHGKLVNRFQPGVIFLMIVFSLFLGHGFITTSFSSETVLQESEIDWIDTE